MAAGLDVRAALALGAAVLALAVVLAAAFGAEDFLAFLDFEQPFDELLR